MKEKKEKVHRFLNKLVAWAGERDCILGVSLVGSYAHDTARLDSDVDLVILTNQPAELLIDSKWLLKFGDVFNKRYEDYGLVQSMRVFYQDALEVEYGITTLEWTQTKPVDPETYRVVVDGMQIMYDPKNAFKHLQDVVNYSDRL